MQAPALGCASPEPGLLCLAHGPLYAIWSALLGDKAAQHALRCSCRALRDFSTPLITAAVVTVPHAPEVGLLLQAVTEVLSQLAAFPSKATLSTLTVASKHNRGTGELIPSVCVSSSLRLASVTNICINTNYMDVTYGDMAAIANTCLHLQSLSMRHVCVIGAALAPLARLPCLTDLRLSNAAAPALNLTCASLAQLTSLTQLHIEDGDAIEYRSGRAQVPHAMQLERLASARILPAVQAMTALHSLSLMLMPAQGDEKMVVDCIAELQYLEHLGVAGGACLDFSVLPPSNCLPCTWRLACAHTLTTFIAYSQALDTTTIRTLASMPCMTMLIVLELDPDVDLSDQYPDCAWQCVTLGIVRSPKQLAWSPLHRVPSLSTTPSYWQWQLSGRDGVETTRALVAKAAELLAEAHKPHLYATPYEGRTRVKRLKKLLLSWAPPPKEPCWSVLTALAPCVRNLNELGMSLCLDDTWRLGGEDAVQGAAQLAALGRMSVHACSAGLKEFCEALGQLPWLQYLQVWGLPLNPDGEGQKLANDVEQVLSELSARRAAAGYGLVVVGVGEGHESEDNESESD